MPGCDMQALGEPVEPGRPGDGIEPARRVLLEVGPEPGREAHGERDAERDAEPRGGALVVERASEAKACSAWSSPDCEHCEAPALAVPGLDELEADGRRDGSRRSIPTVVQRNQGPTPAADLGAHARAGVGDLVGFDLDDDAAVVPEELDDAREQRDGITTDADVAVEQESGAPPSRRRARDRTRTVRAR